MGINGSLNQMNRTTFAISVSKMPIKLMFKDVNFSVKVKNDKQKRKESG